MEKELLIKYVEGNITEEEILKVVEWLDADESHVREYMALQKIYSVSVFTPKENKNPNLQKTRSKSIFRKFTIEILKIAAVACLVMGVSFLLKQEEKLPEETITWQSFYVPAGQRAEVILPDSTKVWLNAKSKITYPSNFLNGRREVMLDGEAYFDVTHRDKEPFLVKSTRVEIEVYGTEFNVYDYGGSQNPEVSLLEGSIALKTPFLEQSRGDSNHSENFRIKDGKLYLNPNNKVRMEDGKMFVSPISQYDYFDWKKGILSFNYEPVGVIMQKLELYFDVKIIVERKSILENRYRGKFRIDDGVEQVLKVLQLEQKFTYKRDIESNVITIK